MQFADVVVAAGPRAEHSSAKKNLAAIPRHTHALRRRSARAAKGLLWKRPGGVDGTRLRSAA
jgi:hypothetical protein